MCTMECNPGTFERIVQRTRFGIKPAVLANGDLTAVRYAFFDDVLQRRNHSNEATVRRICFISFHRMKYQKNF